MTENPHDTVHGAHDVVNFPGSIRHMMQFDTLDLDAAGLEDWDIRLAGGVWVLTRAGGTLDLGGTSGARMRIVRQGVTHLLVGGNGHASILAAISASRGGETILIAPGTYREEHAFVIDHPVTLQGVSEHGTPVLDRSNVAASIVALRAGADQGFAITAPGVVIQGLAFFAGGHPSDRIPDTDISLTPQIRLFDTAGRLKRIFPDIQRALDAAENGDRIMVPEGRHVGDLHVSSTVTLSGMNAGRPGYSRRRGVESTLWGRIVMSPGAESIVIDGLTLLGSFAMAQAAAARRRFAIRNCIIDGRDGDTAISLSRGSESEIVDNLILGGADEAICIRTGFDDLSISGNRIQAAAGAVGIALCGGYGRDRMQILANTFLDGDYGIFIEVNSGLGKKGDVVLLSGNHFGEDHSGIVRGAPAVASVHADGPVPSWLEFSMGVSLQLDTCHIVPPGLGAEVLCEWPLSKPSIGSLIPFPTSGRQSGNDT